MKETQEKTAQTKAKQVKNPKTILHFIAIMLIAITMVSSSFGLYAWARYISATQGNATAQVAKWYFNLKTGEYTQNGPQLLALTRTDGREHVAEGKLAPGTSGVLPIIVDTTGTETDLTYDVTITINNCPKNMVFTPQTPASTTQTVTGDGTAQNPRVRTIRIQKYIPYAQTGELDETISWNWPYETTSGNGVAENDGIDTADSGKEVTVTITAVGNEVMSTPLVASTISYGSGNTVTNGGTIELLTTDDPITLELTSGSENITYNSSNTNVATVSSAGLVKPVAAGTSTITLTGSQSGTNVEINLVINTPGTPVSELTTSNYGQYVNLETTNSILDLENTTLEDGTHPLADWRVFSKDENGGVWLILADYMPNSAFDATTVGLIKGTGNYATYGVTASGNRNTLINGLKGTIAGKANWSNLIAGSSIAEETGVKVQGALELEDWIESWNSNTGYTQLTATEYTQENYSGNANAPGYKVNNNYSVSVSGNSGYSNALYFPHKSYQNINNGTNQVYGYWLASPSASITSNVMYVGSSGNVNRSDYNNANYGVRPAVYLPSNIKLNTDNTVWTIEE